jgi:hypothetical protein
MIAHLSYVTCDRCGTPAQPGDDANAARAIARREGFVRVPGAWICGRGAGLLGGMRLSCRRGTGRALVERAKGAPSPPRHLAHVERPGLARSGPPRRR